MALDPNFGGSSWGYTNGVSANPFSGRDRFMGENNANSPSWSDGIGALSKNSDYLQSRGWQGGGFDGGQVSPEFIDWAANNGLALGKAQPSDKFGGNYGWSLFDESNGTPVGQPDFVGNDSITSLLAPIMMAAAGPLGAAFGGGAMGAAATGATLGGINGGLGAFQGGDNVLSGALSGAAKGGLAGGVAGGLAGTNIAGSMGVDNTIGQGLINGSIKGGVSAALKGGDIGQGLLGGAINGGVGSAWNAAGGLSGIGAAAGSAMGFGDQTAAMPSDQIGAMNAGGGDMNWSDYFGGEGGGLPQDLFGQTDWTGGTTQADLGSILSNSSFNFDPSYFSQLLSDTGPTASIGGSGGMSSSDKAALYGSEGYGQGMTGAQTSAHDSLMNLTGSGSLAGMGSSVAGGLGSLASMVGGGGNLAAMIGAGLGATQGGQQQTSSTQQQLDPRMQEYLYGSGVGDPNSYLGAAQKQWQANPSGINSTMQQGLDMSKAALTDPAYAQTYGGMRTQGNSLMSITPAGNPFTQPGGQMQAGGAGGLLGGDAAGRMQALMARGRGLIG